MYRTGTVDNRQLRRFWSNNNFQTLLTVSKQKEGGRVGRQITECRGGRVPPCLGFIKIIHYFILASFQSFFLLLRGTVIKHALLLSNFSIMHHHQLINPPCTTINRLSNHVPYYSFCSILFILHSFDRVLQLLNFVIHQL